MHAFDDMCNEELHIRHKDGRVAGPVKAAFGKGKFTIFDGSLDISEGDLVDRPLPNGKAERYDVTNAEYRQEFHGIPAHVVLSVRKHGALVSFEKAKTVNIHINNSQGFQVGDHNTQHIVDSFKQVIEQLNKGPGTPAEKAEAKSRLKAFLEHPLTSAAVGAALGSLLPLLS